MLGVKSLRRKWWNVVFPLTALLVVAADQVSKFWIRSSLDLGETICEIGFFRLTHVHNSGAAFGLFQGQSFLLAIIALVGVATLLIYAFFFHHRLPFLDSLLGKLALGLVLGGAVGNLIDRICLGYVTDFIDFNFWPAFNVADSAIVIGTITLAWLLISLATTKESPDGQVT